MATRKPPRTGFGTPRAAAPKPARMDAQGILESLEKLRARLPKVEGAEPPAPKKRVMDEGRFDARSVEDFEMQVVLEALETLAEDVGRIAQAKRQNLIDHVLKVYYVTEEAAREPGQEHLLEHLEKMRKAWEQDHDGRPIPTRAESEARGLVIPPLHPPGEATPGDGMPGDPPAFQDPLDTKPDAK